MDKLTFSIIVPVYNGERFLDKALSSCLQQTVSPHEIILINDGSTDTSATICDTYAGQYPNVFAYHQSNQGASSARNFGISKAQGEYVVFLDCDDFLVLDTLETFHDLAVQWDTPDLLLGSYVQLNHSDHSTPPVEKKKDLSLPSSPVWDSGLDAFAYLLSTRQHQPMACLKICRLDFLVQNDLYFIPNMICEDEEWSVRAFLCANRVAATSHAFYQYEKRGNSISTTFDEQFLTGSIRACYEIDSFLSKCDLSLQHSKLILNWLSKRICRLFARHKKRGFSKSILIQTFAIYFAPRNDNLIYCRKKQLSFRNRFHLWMVTHANNPIVWNLIGHL
ncbi:MAG: glycosyltransferase [Phycisphaerales bacterium]|nr:glycosyltransferase [Phycisphaerales bacterium]